MKSSLVLKGILIILLLPFVLSINGKCYEAISEENVRLIGTDELENAVPRDVQNMLGGNTPEAADLQSGLASIVKAALKKLLPSFREAFLLCVKMFAVSVLAGIAAPMSKSVDSGEMSMVGVCGVAAIVGICVTSVYSAVNSCITAINSVQQFSRVLISSMAVAMVLSGNAVSASVGTTITLAVTGTFIELINVIFLPMIYIYIGMTAVNSVLENGLVSGMAKGVKSFYGWLMKIVMAVYISYSGISSSIAASSDAAAVKTAKFAISGVIPVVGSIVSDAAGSVMSGAVIIKNTIGIFGLLTVCGICIIPFLNAAVHYVSYKTVSILCSVITIKPVYSVIDGIGDGFGMAMGILGTTAVLLFIAITLSIVMVKAV